MNETLTITSLPNSTKQVLLVGNFLSKMTGSRGICEELAPRLRARQWQVITTSDKVGRLARLRDMIQTAWQQRQHYRIAQVDVYSGSAFIWAEAVCAVLRQMSKPYVLILRGGDLPFFAQQWPGRVRQLLSSAVSVTTPSRYLLQELRPFRADLTLLPNPLALSQYEFRLRQHLQPCLIWLRALHDVYNPGMAVQVLAQLVSDFPNVHLLMVGPDKGDGSWQATQQLAAKLSVDQKLTMVGGIPKAQVPLYLNKGDIFLNTTTIDNTPISVMEAMACGLCVVSTNVGGVPYLLANEEDGLLVNSQDVVGMKTAVHNLFTNPTLAAQLSQNGRDKVKQFDWEVILPQWEQLLLAAQ